MIELVEINNPDLSIIEHYTKDIKFYQTDTFIILMSLCCCLPLGLFMMWYYKKFNKVIRIVLTSILAIIGISILFMTFYTYTCSMNEIRNAFDQIHDGDLNSAETPTQNNEIIPIDTEVFSTTLTAGHYLVGTDIPVGTYSFFSKRGSGNLYSSDGSVNVIFDYNSESGKSIGLENFGTEELKNIHMADGVLLSVTGSQEISAGCDDGEVKTMKARNQEDIEEIEVGYGHYGAPDNIPSGTYDIELLEGKGNIICSSPGDGGINEIMGEPTPEIKQKKVCILQNSKI